MAYRSEPRVRFSPAPSTVPWFELALLPIMPLCNVMIGAAVYPGWRTVSVHWVPELPPLIAFLRSQTRPVICYGWHRYELLTWLSFKVLPNDLTPTAIAHDGLLSRALHQASTWFGFPVYVYRRRSPQRPKEQLIEFLRQERPVVGLFADAGGPDGQVRQGLVDLAQSTDALLVPMAMRSSPSWAVGSRQRYFIPLPFSSVTAFHGMPIEAGGITRPQCQAALDDLESYIESI